MELKKVSIHIYPDSRPKVFLEIMKWNTEVESVCKSINQHPLVRKPNFQGYELSNIATEFSKGMPVVMSFANSGHRIQ
jgi:hypothetical protein